MRPELSFHLLGPFQVTFSVGEGRRPSSSRLELLLAWLLLHRDVPQPRSHLAFQLWPDSSEKQALGNLRNLLMRLRDWLPELWAWLEVQHNSLRILGGEGLKVDVEGLRGHLEKPPDLVGLGQVLQLYQGDLLPGRAESWLVVERDQLRLRFVTWLSEGAQRFEEARHYGEALQCVRRRLVYDPLHEASWEAHLRLLALLGEKQELARSWQRCVGAFRREQATEPGPGLKEAYDRLLQGARVEGPPAVSPWPLVGREAEWQQLLRCWREAEQGRPGAMLIRGTAGIGKTRLLEELQDYLGRQGVRTLTARCYELDRQLPFRSVSTMLRGCALESLGGVWRRELARLLPELLTRDQGLNPAPPLVSGWQRSTLFEAIARGVLSRQPLAILVDDLQWIDPDSLEVLHYLLRYTANARLLVVLGQRAEGAESNPLLERFLLGLEHDGRLSRTMLQPLTESQAVRLAEAVAGRALQAEFLGTLQRRSGGSPLFILELTRLAHHSPGDVERATSRVLMSVIASRLSPLSSQARRLAELCAIFGRAVSDAELERAFQEPLDGYLDALDELTRQEVLVEEQSGGYDFTHGQLRDSVEQSMSGVRKRKCHLAVAAALELEPGLRLDPLSSEIAEHYRRAGVGQKAVNWFLRAAQYAERVRAMPRAVECLDRALALLEDPGPTDLRISLVGSRLRILGWVARPEVVMAELEGLRCLLEDRGDHAALTWLEASRLKVLHRMGREDSALALSNALVQACAGGQPVLEADLRLWRARIQLKRGEHPQRALEDLLVARDLVATQRTEPIYLQILETLSECLGYLGQYEEAQDWALAGLELARGCGLDDVVAQFGLRLAVIRSELEPQADQLPLIDGAVSAYEQMGLSLWLAIAILERARYLVARRQFVQARGSLGRLLALGDALDTPALLLEAYLWLAWIALHIGDPATAASWLKKAEARCDTTEMPLGRCVIALQWVQVDLTQGLFLSAASRLQGLDGRGCLPLACRLHLLRGRVQLTLGEVAEAVISLQEACRQAPDSYLPWRRENRIECESSLAEALCLAGQPEEGVARLAPVMAELEQGLDGLTTPQRPYLVWARLQAQLGHEVVSRDALARARELVLELAGTLEDGDRGHYVTGVALNRIILDS